ncbi:MAG: S1 RNA-binding domain-containing protein [Puniceicoccales bacterium]|jgi:polyribonucleotide nucleotidyltransferase|nr:S1 RNA-binding domain-containing protein [Puniceicoccales bacterium]
MSNIEVGKTYNGTVKSVRNFGVFVECIAGEEGLVHISELDNCRIENIDAVCSVGDLISVKCIGVDDQGRVRLSHRAVICEEQGLPYEVREVKPKRSFSGGGFGNRNSGGRSFGPRKFGNDNRGGGGGRSFGGGGFGHSRRSSSGGSGFSRDY